MKLLFLSSAVVDREAGHLMNISQPKGELNSFLSTFLPSILFSLPRFEHAFVGRMIHFLFSFFFKRYVYFSLDHSLGAAHAEAQ